MKRIIVLISLIAAVFVCAFVLWNRQYVKFEARTWNGNDYVKVVTDTSFSRRLQQVLQHYKVSYEFTAGNEILVRRLVAADKEMIANYTKKALDDKWLETHVRK